MAKKKVKSKQSEQAQLKIEAARRRNEYIRRFKQVCDMIDPGLFNTFAPIQIEAIYGLRGAAIKVLAEGKVPKVVVMFANEYARLIQNQQYIKLTNKGDKVSLSDYNYIVSPLEWMIRRDAPYEPTVRPNPDLWSELPWFDEFMKDREERFRQASQSIRTLRLFTSFFMSDLRHTIYSTRFMDDANAHFRKGLNDGRMFQAIRIRPFRAERKRINLPNGDTRSALRFTVVSPSDEDVQEFVPISFATSLLGRHGSSSKKRLPVYVTEHALNRLEERLGCSGQGLVQYEIFVAIMNKNKTIPIGQGKMLVEYYIYTHKVGYLVVSIPHNVILIHSFLLLTNNTTPEGALLQAQLGVSKLDKEYLGIDKLQTFLRSDIFEYEDTCQLFRNAGCESLIEASKALKYDPLWMHDGETIQVASRMREYLKTNEPEGAEYEDEPESDELLEQGDLQPEGDEGGEGWDEAEETEDGADGEEENDDDEGSEQDLEKLFLQ
ncbi:hypothetical protein FACS1894181_00950 [Bacteroidia bacterium]|nr:hypothetical protein FACS1894181_00950 [Bacteroidia bacterium]